MLLMITVSVASLIGVFYVFSSRFPKKLTALREESKAFSPDETVAMKRII